MGNNLSPHDDPAEMARAWVHRLSQENVSPSDHAAFETWLNQSPRHGEAYQHELAADSAVEALRERFADHPRYTLRGLWIRRTAMAGVAAAAAAALFVVMPMATAPAWSPAVATQVAEVRDVALPDGSIITVGARTRFETAFTDRERRLRLSDGEAYFRVAHDAGRPFLIETQGALVRVVGTEFEVKSSADRVRVVVARGIVEVTEPPRLSRLIDGPRTVRLTAGQEISISAAAQPELTAVAAPPQPPAAWRDGLLVYEDASLAEVIADANRYSSGPIVLEGRELQTMRVTAVYPADQVERLLSSLDATMPVDVDRRPGGEIVITAVR